MQDKQKVFQLEDGSKVVIFKWKTSQQIQILPKVIKTLGVPFFLMASKAESEDEIIEAVPQALYMLCEEMEQNNPIKFFESLLTNTRINDQQVDIDQHISDFDDMLYIAAEVLKLNFGKLLSGKGFSAFRQVAVPLAAQESL